MRRYLRRQLSRRSRHRHHRRAASRATAQPICQPRVGYLVLLNGVAALILLACASQLTLQIKAAGAVVDAMLLFGVGATIALASTFFAYLRRTLRLQAPERVPLRTALWWLSVLALPDSFCTHDGCRIGRRASCNTVRQVGGCESISNRS